MSPQEIATCCRVALALMGGRMIGPELAQVKMDTLFVRNEAFLYRVARELAGKLGSVSEEFGRLRRDNEVANNENAERRLMRREAVAVAGDVLDVMISLEKSHGERWQYFEKMIKGQTLGQIARRVGKADRAVARASCVWIAQVMEQRLGEAKLGPLLTLRSAMV